MAGDGGIKGAYSVGGITTFKICSLQFVPDENAFLKLDVYFFQDGELKISIDVGDGRTTWERFSHLVEVKGGGKWKRLILKAADFKGEQSGMPLKSFAFGKVFSLNSVTEQLYAVTNLLWL